MKGLWFIPIVIIFYLSFTSSGNSAESLTLLQAYWVDESGTATLADARNADFKTYDGSLAEGYSSAALWLKLRVAGRVDGERLALVVKPAFLRHIEFYDPDLQGYKALPLISGRDAPIAQTNHIGLDNGFVIPSTGKSRDVFLRIVTTTSLTVQVSVLPEKMAYFQSTVLGGAVATYFAFILAFCLWGLVNWGVRQDSLYALFVVRQFYSLAHIFVFFGTLRFFFADSLDAETREFIYSFVTCTVVIAAGYFDMRLISEFGGARWLRRVIKGLLALPSLTIPLIFLGQTQTALQLTAVDVNLIMCALVLFAFSTRTDPALPYSRASRWLVRLGFLAMTAVVVVPVLMYQNILQSNVPIFAILFFHAMISTIILFALLSIRARQRDLMAQETRLLVQVREAELLHESGRRIEKERFLSMLTHELRNPLSVIRLLGGSNDDNSTTVQKAAQDMAEVIERVEQSEKIDGSQIRIDRAHFDAAGLVSDIVRSHRAADRLQLAVDTPHRLFNDAGLFRHIVENLLDNAAKYSATGSPIHVTIAKATANASTGLRLTVANAIGDAGAPDPERLFTKYYRSKRAHRHPGSGLGLFLVASWADAMGGNVACSADAKTVTFSLWLPL